MRLTQSWFYFALIFAAILAVTPDHSIAAQEPAPDENPMRYGVNDDAGRYFDVGDAKIYYETYGKGEPLVLIHGGLYGYIEEYKHIIPDLTRDYFVIAIATRGHGRSELGTKPLSYRLFADDFAAVIRHVEKRPVTVVGFSDGAIAAYHLAAAYPDLVKALIGVGGPIGIDDDSEEGSDDLSDYDTLAELEKLQPEFVKKRTKIMPDPKVWDRFLAGLVKMWNQNEYISHEQFKSIQCPALVAAGDQDPYVTVEHLVKMYRLLPKGQLAVIPQSKHLVFKTKPQLMIQLIRGFI